MKYPQPFPVGDLLERVAAVHCRQESNTPTFLRLGNSDAVSLLDFCDNKIRLLEDIPKEEFSTYVLSLIACGAPCVA